MKGNFMSKNKNQNFKTLIPKIDVVFQSLFSKNHPKQTKAFVEALLEEKIESIKINEGKDLIRSKPTDKLGIFGVKIDFGHESVEML